MNEETQRYGQIKLFSVLAVFGLLAVFYHVHIPHTDALIDGRWAFGFMGFALLQRWWAALLLGAFLSLPLGSDVPFWVGFFGNLLYAVPALLVIRPLHGYLLRRWGPGWFYALGWLILVLFCYQAFTTPAVWGVLALLEDAPVWPKILEGWRIQPFLVESVLVALFSATAMVAFLAHQRLRRSQWRLDHINRVLMGIRNVNQLIVSEDDPNRLIERACANLTETLGYLNAWIALLGDVQAGESTIAATASSGFDGGFENLRTCLASGEFPACMRQALECEGLVVLADPKVQCPDCPLSMEYGSRAGLCRRLTFDGKTYGVLAVSVPADYAHDEEERDLFNELADDLAFALHEIESARRFQESQRDLKRAQAIAQIGSWRLDRNSGTVIASDETRRIYGMGDAEWSIERVQTIPLPQYRDMLDSALRNLIQDGAPYDVEFEILRPSDDAIRHIHSVAEYDADRNVVIGTLQDITEAKQADEALRVSLIKYKTLFTAFPLGITVTDSAGKILESNLMAEGLLGVPQEEHAQRGIDGPEWRIVRPDGTPMPAEEFASVRALKENHLVEHVEMGIVKPAGEITWIDVTATPFSVEGGGVVITYTDITERKQAESHLLQFKQIVSSTSDGISLIDKDYRYVIVNKAYETFSGKKQEDLIGIKVQDYLGQEVFERIRDRLDKCLSGKTIKYQDWFEYPTVGKRFVDITYFPYVNEMGSISGIVANTRDITERKQAEDALRESEAKLKEAQAIARMGRWEMDLATNHLTWSDGIFDMFEVSRETFAASYEAFLDFIHPDDRSLVDQTYRGSIEKRTPYNIEHRLLMKDGQVKWVNEMGRTEYDEAGNPLRSVGTVQDITERKQAEVALKESEERLCLAHKATREVVWDWDIIHDRQQWNEAGTAVFGWSDIVESPQTAGWWVERVHPDDRQRVDEGFFAVVENPADNFWHDEYRFRKSDGSYADVIDRGYVLRDAEGKAIRMVGAMQDTTERKQAEVALNKSRMLLEATERLSGIGGWEWDVEKQTLAWTAETYRLHGFDPEEMIPGSSEFVERSLACYDPEDREKVRRSFQRCVTEGEPYDIECGFTTATGSRRQIRTVGQAVREGGRIVRLVGNFMDITERKQAESQLRLQSLVLNQIQDCVTVTDLAGVITYVNDAEVRVLGYSREELIGSSTSKYGEDPEQGPTQQEIIEKTLNHGTWRGEVINQTADGQEVILDCRTQVVFDEHGIRVALAGIATDITERKQAEEALRKSEEKWRNILVNTPQVGIALDPEARIVFANKHFLELTGWSTEEILGGNWFDLFIPEDVREEVRGVFDTVMHTRDTVAFSTHQNEILTKTGEKRNVAWSNVLTKDANGDVVDVTCLGIDLTQRKQAEEALRESEERFRVLVESSSVGVMRANASGEATYANPAMGRVLEVEDPKELLGTGWESFFTPESLEAVRRENPKRSESLPSSYEVEVVGKKGTKCNLLVCGGPLFSSDGGFQGTIATFLDISEIKRAEEALREIQAFQAALIACSPVALYSIHADGLVQSWNPAAERIFGWKAEEVIGRPSPIVPEDQQEAFEAMLQEVLEGHTFTGREVIRSRKDGSLLTGRLSTAAIRDASGRIVGILGALEDISESKMLEEELAQSQKMESVGRLAGGVAHDFNNMLNVILGNADLMMDDLPDEGYLRTGIEEIRKAAERSADLTRQLLAFARRQTVAPKVLDLNDTVESMLKMLGRLIGEDIDLMWQPAKALAPVRVDPAQIDQVLANLTVNARDAIGHNVGKVTIETGQLTIDEAYCATHAGFVPGHYVTLAVSDDGCGMDEETQAQIFEPFFTTKDVGEGTGLGLATVYGIVRQNQGFINVYSEPGQGTTFKIYLPVYKSSQDRAPQVHVPTEPPSRGHETVLLVEDEPSILKMAGMMLERLGYTVLAAATPGSKRSGWPGNTPAISICS